MHFQAIGLYGSLQNVSLSVSDIGNPYSLDVFEGHVYWTTKERGEVWKTDKFGKGTKVKVLTINPWLTQVRIYQEHRHNHSGQCDISTLSPNPKSTTQLLLLCTWEDLRGVSNMVKITNPIIRGQADSSDPLISPEARVVNLGLDMCFLVSSAHYGIYRSALVPIIVPNPCKDVCSHLCLLRPGGYTCTCPQGSSLVGFNPNECDAGMVDHIIHSHVGR